LFDVFGASAVDSTEYLYQEFGESPVSDVD